MLVRSAVRSLPLLLTVLFSTAGSALAAETRPPNVVVFADDQ